MQRFFNKVGVAGGSLSQLAGQCLFGLAIIQPIHGQTVHIGRVQGAQSDGFDPGQPGRGKPGAVVDQKNTWQLTTASGQFLQQLLRALVQPVNVVDADDEALTIHGQCAYQCINKQPAS